MGHVRIRQQCPHWAKDPGDYEAKMVATGLTELRDALVARGFLGLDEAECVYVLKDLGGKPHIEAAGLSANASERFLAAVKEMGYAPDNYETLPLM
jgi:hypothetical protein